ncbi:OmpP1/FadL family transporter [Rhizobium sp. BK251]|uniref:OmpP1/FadL family transporter n=1 Tax=Rhizobium sp. BK251 TaxID=2512125 RepID=UPI0010501E72|nr:OmpP1/FadL family transporter [Rhizobium sp. BK251]TCL67271.1 long-chain fatty acid transport protein [Rhizobium sp. BK251]
MASRMLSGGALSLIIFSSSIAPSFAGGLERGGYNIDLLFDTSRVTMESSATYVKPERKLKNVVDTDTSNTNPLANPPTWGGGDLNYRPHTAEDTPGYWIPRVGIKVGVTDAVDCLADYSQPWGAHDDPGLNWAGANQNIETKVESDNYALTCSYKFDAGPGQLRLIGGGFYQEVGGFKERLVQDFTGTGLPFSGVGRLELSDNGWGWRTGVAYEIPEYAIRTSLVYNSVVELSNLTGTIDLTNLGPMFTKYDVSGSATMPDSLEWKWQTGIAPDWLAFGGVKWTAWSKLQVLTFSPAVVTPLTPPTTLDLIYRDGWTVTGGVGHKFNDQWSGAVSLTWDRGTSQGYGIQTDVWTVAAGVAYAPQENLELRLAGVLGLWTGGESGAVTYNGQVYGGDASYSFDDDLVAAVSTSLKVKF